MNHPVVGRRHGDRDGAASDLRARIDRPHEGGEEAGARLRLMHGRNPIGCETRRDLTPDTGRVRDDDVHASVSKMLGKIGSYPSRQVIFLEWRAAAGAVLAAVVMMQSPPPRNPP